MREISINGERRGIDEASILVSDASVRYGDILFETIRVVRGRPYLIDRHLARLRRSIEMLGYPSLEEALLSRSIDAMITVAGTASGRLRVSTTRGDLPHTPPTLIAEFTSFDEIPPIPLPLELIVHPSPLQAPVLPFKPKGPGYATELRILEEVRRVGYHECLRLTTEGFVGEGCLSNIFWHAGGVLHTPSTTLGVLPGIMRERIIEIATEEGVRCEIGAWNAAQLAYADEIFMTNALRGIMPVRRIVDLVDLSDAEGEWSRRLSSRVTAEAGEA